MKLNIPNELDEYKPVTLDRDQELLNVAIEDADFTNVQTNSLAIDSSRLARVSLASGKIKHLNLTDVSADGIMMFGAVFDGSGWLRVEVSGGVLSGMAVTASNLKDVIFRKAKLDLTNFRASKLKNVMFTECNMREADFYGAKLTGVVFENCDLDGAVFDAANFENVRFPGSNLSGIKGVLSMHGVSIDAVQLVVLAPILASELGIKVE